MNMDLFDRATENEEIHRKASLDAARNKQATGPSLSHCEECGKAIPEARRKAVPGCRRCIACQSDYERGI